MYVRSRLTVCLGQRWRAATFLRWFNPLTAHTSRVPLLSLVALLSVGLAHGPDRVTTHYLSDKRDRMLQ